jgi:hypothetical protein
MFEPYEEPLCDCGSCKYCDAHSSSEYDYDDQGCTRCNGAGCTKCEE